MILSLGIQHYLEERKSWPLETITLLGYSKLPTCLIKSITCHISWEHLRTNTPKRCPFHYRGMECKSRKSRNTWSNKFGLGVQNEAGKRLIEFCKENALVLANTLFQQHKTRLYTWTSPDGQHRNQTDYIFLQPKMEKLYTVNKNKTRSWLWLRSWTPYCQIQGQIEESRENC